MQGIVSDFLNSLWGEWKSTYENKFHEIIFIEGEQP